MVLDVGAGPNTSLFSYINSRAGVYTALDKNSDFLDKQKETGAITMKGDVRSLPFKDDSFDISHTRFVISHLGLEKQKAVEEVLRVTKPQGKAIFMEYDWTTAHGSPFFERVKYFMINGGLLFDADFGAELEATVKGSGLNGAISTTKHPATHMTDYLQILNLREAGTTDLRMQGDEAGVTEWNKILNDFQKETEDINAPGFYFPGIVVVTVRKD